MGPVPEKVHSALASCQVHSDVSPWIQLQSNMTPTDEQKKVAADLPLEIVPLVAQQLYLAGNYGTLAQFCSTSRTHRELLIPTLYRRIHFHSAKSYRLLRQVPPALLHIGALQNGSVQVLNVNAYLDNILDGKDEVDSYDPESCADRLGLVQQMTIDNSSCLSPASRVLDSRIKITGAFSSLRNVYFPQHCFEDYRSSHSGVIPFIAPRSACFRLSGSAVPNISGDGFQIANAIDKLEDIAMTSQHRGFELRSVIHGAFDHPTLCRAPHVALDCHFLRGRINAIDTPEDWKNWQQLMTESTDWNNTPPPPTSRAQQLIHLATAAIGRGQSAGHHPRIRPIRLYGALEDLDWRGLDEEQTPGATFNSERELRRQIRAQCLQGNSTSDAVNDIDAFLEQVTLLPSTAGTTCADCGHKF